MKINQWKIEKVKPYPNNPRSNDQAVDVTAKSIQEYGWQQPIVVDTNGVVIARHTRLKAAKQLKLKEVPVVVAEGLTDEQVRGYRIMDNKSGEAAEWEMDLLNLEIQELVDMDFDIDLTGFSLDDFDFDDDEEEKEEEEEDSEVDMDEMDGDMFIKLGYSFEEYQDLQDKLSTLSETPEIIFKRAVYGS